MMASYVFEQAGDKAAAEKIRQDSLKSAMSIQDKPAEQQTEPKQMKNQPHLSQNVIKKKTGAE